MMTMPMAKKFGVPIFLKKSEKYSTVSIIPVFRRWQRGRCQKEVERDLLFCTEEQGDYRFAFEMRGVFSFEALYHLDTIPKFQFD